MSVVRIRVGGNETTVAWDEWEERVRSGRVPPDAEVLIPAITGDRFVRADTLDSWSSLRRLEEEAFRRHVVAGGPPIATALLVGLQIRVWWLEWISGLGGAIVGVGTNWAPHILENGQSWRLVTMGLLHVDYDHLALNMLWLAYTGWNVERALGWKNLVAVYFGAVVLGAVMSMTMSPYRPSLGASGGVYGLVAACVVFGLWRPDLLPDISRRTYGFALLPYLLWTFWVGLQSEGVDNWAHFGGIVAGCVLAVLLDPETLERRPRWNLRVRGAIGALIAAAVAIPVLAGPRLVRTDTDDVVGYQALRRRDREIPPPEPPSYRPVLWQVPAGWDRDVTVAGDAGFCSPAGPRCLSVNEQHHADPLDVDGLRTVWLDHLRASKGDDVQASAPEAVTFAGWPGQHVHVDLPDRSLDWWGAARGNYTLAAVWQTRRGETRTDPLRDRLIADIAWGDPSMVAEARRTLALAPTSRTARLTFARARMELGERAEAIADLDALIAESPDDDAWVARLALEPGGAPEVRALLDRALAQTPTPEVLLAGVVALERVGEGATARGLLDLAWNANPGDRMLRRARKQRGQPYALDPETNVPWEARWDVLTGREYPKDAVAAWTHAPLLLSEADARAAALSARDQALVDAIPGLSDAGLQAVLLRLRDGPAPTAPDARADAVTTLASDLDALHRGYPPPWLTPAMVDAVRRRGTTVKEGP